MTISTIIQEMRFFAEYKGTLRKICKVKFARNDHSIYLIPYAPQGLYFYGQRNFPDQETSDTFNFVSDGTHASTEPHLSIHESGQVHVYSEGLAKAGPFVIPNLMNLRGGHIASVTPDSFASLPIHEGRTRSGSRIDHIMPIDAGIESGRLAIFINGESPKFAAKSPSFVFSQKRPSNQGTLYIGIDTIAQLPLGDDKQKGTTILAGWNPDLSADKITDYLYIRGR